MISKRSVILILVALSTIVAAILSVRYDNQNPKKKKKSKPEPDIQDAEIVDEEVIQEEGNSEQADKDPKSGEGSQPNPDRDLSAKDMADFEAEAEKKQAKKEEKPETDEE